MGFYAPSLPVFSMDRDICRLLSVSLVNLNGWGNFHFYFAQSNLLSNGFTGFNTHCSVEIKPSGSYNCFQRLHCLINLQNILQNMRLPYQAISHFLLRLTGLLSKTIYIYLSDKIDILQII